MINEAVLRKAPLGLRLYVKALRGTFLLLAPLSPAWSGRLAHKMFTTPTRKQPSRWEREFEKRGTAEQVSIAGQSLRFFTHGSGSKTVLLVHGWGGRASQMGSYAEAFVAAGYRVISVDGPAHGESSGKTSDMVDYSYAIAGVVAHLKGVEAIVAHSVGAASTLFAMAQKGLDVQRLVLVACFSDAVFITEEFGQFFRVGRRGVQTMRERMVAHYQHQFTWDGIAPRVSITRCTQPVLLIHDHDDEDTPFEQSLELKAAYPAAELFATDKAGHYQVLREAGAINAAVEFVSKAL